MGRFDGKVAVVTGAGRGIGRAIAECFGREGAAVVLCGRTMETLEEVAGGIPAGPGEAPLCVAVDVSDATAVATAISEIVEKRGGIDILANNAGITADAFLPRMNEEDWDRVIDVNLKGTFLVTKAVSKVMIKRRAGAIVNVSSVIGLIGNAGQCNYAASKAGMLAFTKSAARELAARNIRVNAVAPGFVLTDMTSALPDDIREQMLKNIPLRRFGTPEDVANVVLFLAGDEASYMTGQTLTISGGMVM